MKKIAQFKYPSRQPNRWRHLTTTHTLTYTLGCNKGITLDELIPSYNTFCVRQAKARETYECFGLSSLWLLINQKRCNKFQLDITTQKVVALSCDYFHRMAQNRNALRNWLKKCSIEVCVCGYMYTFISEIILQASTSVAVIRYCVWEYESLCGRKCLQVKMCVDY